MNQDMNLRWIMGTYEGREFIWELISFNSGFFSNPYNPNEHTMDYNLGRQSIGLSIYNTLLKPEYADLLMKMHNERVDREKKSKQQRKIK